MKILLSEGYTHEQFLDARKHRIGGSDIAAIAGLNPFRTPLDVWAEKTGRKEPQPENARMKWGRDIEPLVAELFESKMNVELFKVNQMWVHDDHDFALATPDYQISDDSEAYPAGLVEIKTTTIHGAKYWSDEKAPDSAALQLQWQLEIGKLPYGFCAGLIAGDPDNLCTPFAERNKDVGAQLLELAGKFIELIKSDTPPGAQAGDGKLIEMLFPATLDIEVELPPSAEELFAKYDAAAKLAKRYEKEQEQAKAELMMLLGSARVGRFGDRRAEWKQMKRKAYTVNAVEKMIFAVR